MPEMEISPEFIAAAEELEVEDLLAFTLGQHRDKAEIADFRTGFTPPSRGGSARRRAR